MAERIKVHVLHVPGAHPERDEIVAQLREEADACVHEDPEREGCMATWLKCVACADATDDDLRWTVILSDDALPLPGWRGHLTEAQWRSPRPVLGLTYFGQYGLKALNRGAPYAVGKNLTWGGAVTYRRDVLKGLARWAPKIVAATGYKHDDRLAATYAAKIGSECALVSRAIFGQPVKESLLGHGGLVREPAATIVSHPGPGYGAIPRYVRVASTFYPQMRDLLKIDTEEPE